jgi:hypothetical protein
MTTPRPRFPERTPGRPGAPTPRPPALPPFSRSNVPPSAQAPAQRAIDPGRNQRSPLIDLLPTFSQPIEAGFLQLQTPSTTVTAGDGQVLWYGLRSVSIPEDLSQEVALFGIDYLVASPNPLGSGDAAPWGDINRKGAAVIIGKNLPVSEGLWYTGSTGIRGLGGPGDSASTQKRQRFISVIRLPDGDYGNTDATAVADLASRKYVQNSIRFGPFVHRLSAGERLDIALVFLPGNTDNYGEDGHVLNGHVDVNVWIADTDSTSSWRG